MEGNQKDFPLIDCQFNPLESNEPIAKAEHENELACLKDITKFVGHQLKDDREPWWSCNKYIVDDENSKPILRLSEEESQPVIVRALCSSNRPYFMSVVDCSTKDKIFELERIMRCCSPIFCPWSRSMIIIRDKREKILGYVKHAARETCVSWFDPSVYYEVASAEGFLQYIIKGPGGCVFECTKPNSFRVMTPDLSKQVGEIFHDWRGCCGGSFSFCLSPENDRFTLRVDAEISVTNKALLFGALVLAHFNYMEVL